MAIHNPVSADGALVYIVPKSPPEPVYGRVRRCVAHFVSYGLKTCLPVSWFNFLSRTAIQVLCLRSPERYYTEINADIYLGGMPLKNWGHIQKINELGVGAILSLNEDHEFQPHLYFDPVQPSYWKEKGIVFRQIPTPDLDPVKHDDLTSAIEFIREQTGLGKKVYIHCVGGRGRSAAVVAGYLLSAQKCSSVMETYVFIKSKRDVVWLNPRQLESLSSWWSLSSKN